MKRDNFGIVLCALMMVLIMGLSAAVLGFAFGGTRLVPVSSVRAPAESYYPSADPAYWLSVDLDPAELYEQACRHTVYLSWESKTQDEKGARAAVSATGFVISQDGYILTNAHCVEDALKAGDPMLAEFKNGKQAEAVIVGSDPETEVALLKIETDYVPAAELGRSRDLKPCQTVYVMGQPDEDLKFTMTSGIISALDRSITFTNGVTLNMFQIDAPVNPGNSGGPVYNIHGKVIGVVTAKSSDITKEGLGFALPIDDVMKIAAELKTFGYVTGRPLLGIIVQNIEADRICQGSPAGAMVYSAEEGLAGAKAGLLPGDIIVGIDDRLVTSLDDLTEVKKFYRAFDTVTVHVWRKGESVTLKLTFDEVTPEHPTGSVVIPEEENKENSGEGESETPVPPAEDGAGENPESP